MRLITQLTIKLDRNQNIQMEISQSIPKNNTTEPSLLRNEIVTLILRNKNTLQPKIKPLFCNLLMVSPLKNTPEQLQTK